jgi:hypothetical protein
MVKDLKYYVDHGWSTWDVYNEICLCETGECCEEDGTIDAYLEDYINQYLKSHSDFQLPDPPYDGGLKVLTESLAEFSTLCRKLGLAREKMLEMFYRIMVSETDAEMARIVRGGDEYRVTITDFSSGVVGDCTEDDLRIIHEYGIDFTQQCMRVGASPEKAVEMLKDVTPKLSRK